jgi:hypothetical protein
MKLYKFVALRGEYVTLTADRAGRNLPSINEPWRFLKEITIDEETIRPAEVNGYIIWPCRKK